MRRAYVDWARGLAVLVMIEAYTFDAWTRAADRSTQAFRNLTILGGLAAPFFLWLAGLALVLSAKASDARTGDRRATAEAAIRRGLEIFILAFLFRLQALIVTPAARRDDRSERRLQRAFAAGGFALIGLGFQTASLPTIYRSSSFWTSSPSYFVIRVGVIMLALSVMYALAIFAKRLGLARIPLEKLGRDSLFVYWIHVELVYGYASWPIRQRLQLWQTAIAYVIFCALMYGAIIARDSVLDRWRTRAHDRSPFIIGS